MSLSMEAQGLVEALQHAAAESKQRHNVGSPFLHEDQVGGLAAVQPQIDELRAAGVAVSVSKGGRDRIIMLG